MTTPRNTNALSSKTWLWMWLGMGTFAAACHTPPEEPAKGEALADAPYTERGGKADRAAAVDEAPQLCGGIAGIPCPHYLQCVDDPRDDCDPNDGDADCFGICVPPSCGGFGSFPCPGDLICVDDPDDTCDPEQGGADCPGICRVPCGGFGNFPCPDGLSCVDDPNDTCHPDKGGADCPGVCE